MEKPSSSHDQRERLRVLVVDDDPIHQKVTPAIVRSLGHDVALVKSGEEAVHAVERRHFDVVLMDLHMPGMDGIAATLEIRRRVPSEDRPAVIALSSTTVEEDAQRCLDAGMDYFLPKPTERRRLAELLNSIRSSIASKLEGQGASAIRVLVVDDDPIVTELYRKALERAGFGADVAHDGGEGLAKLQTFEPHVVLLDLNMPRQSGMEWLRNVRSMPKYAQLPVVVVTELPIDSPDVKRAERSDVTDVLFKNQSSTDAIVGAVRWAIAQAPSPDPDRRG